MIESRPIRVKVVSKNTLEHEHFRDLPSRHTGIEFVLDPCSRDYDWFVVYDDLPSIRGERYPINAESLACPAHHTILITYEPSSIKFYGSDYIEQFEYVLTSQDSHVLKHPNRHSTPPIGLWYYGTAADALQSTSPPAKSGDVCIFLATKRTRLPFHRKRVRFQRKLIRLLPELDLYGRDIHHLPKKADCLDGYRYSIAIENHIERHHWTEKLSDCFLGYCLPFYAGCPNASDYFPKESFIAIDIDEPEAAVETIRRAMAAGEYEKRLPAVVEARRRVVEEYNLGNVIGDIITLSRNKNSTRRVVARTDIDKIRSRRAVILGGLGSCLRYSWGKLMARRSRRG